MISTSTYFIDMHRYRLVALEKNLFSTAKDGIIPIRKFFLNQMLLVLGTDNYIAYL